MTNLLALSCQQCESLSGNSQQYLDCAKNCTPDKNTNPSEKIINPLLPENLSSKSGESFLASIFPPLVGWIFVVGAIGFFFMVVLGAIQWIFSGGDKGAVEQARGRITNALIGIILLFSTFAIINLVETFFGINILTIDIGPLKIQ
ncbi:MAG: pilin [Patescibacteria group bacterium]